MSEEQKEFLEGTEELNEEITWDAATEISSQYHKFEPGVREQLTLTNWSFYRKETTKYKSEEKVIAIFFKCDVIAVNGEKVEQVLDTNSKLLIGALREFLEEKSPSEEVTLSIKRIGTDNKTQYDVELPQGA